METGIQRPFPKPLPFYPIFDRVEWFEHLLPVLSSVSLPVETPLWVQLRVKNVDEKSIRHILRQCQIYCERYGCQLIVNDYWKIAIDEGCTFVHLGQEDLDTADISAIRRANIRFGLSTHSEKELMRALAFAPDYIALGPVYPTSLKAMKWGPQGLARVAQWKQALGTIPLIAIGGMTVERASTVWEAGADGISVVSDILLNKHPKKRFQHWLHLSIHQFKQG